MDHLEAGYGVSQQPQARVLWAELAAAARVPADAPGEVLGRALNSGSAEVLSRVGPALLEVMRMTPSAHAEFGPALAALVQAIPVTALTKALEQNDVPDRRRALQTAARLLPPRALVALLVAAAPAYKQQLSEPFRQLLVKLAAEAETWGGTFGQRAEEAFRALTQHLNERWATSLLNTGSSGFDLLEVETGQEVFRSALAPGATRVLQLSLETGAVGPMVWLGLRSLIEGEEGVRAVVEMLKDVEPSAASSLITEQVATPTRLGLLLRESPIDWPAADALIRQLGTSAARPLIDQLIAAETRVMRRAIMDRIVQLGPDIHPMVLERIEDERWYVVRNMVVLLREAGSFLEPVLADNLATHPDARVRREVLLLRLERSAGRDRALSDGLRDPDKQVLRTALHAAGGNLPGSAVLVLARRVAEPGFPAELRVLSLHLLGRSNAPTALEALLKVVDGGRTLLGRHQLAPRSPELVAALAGLARSWSAEPRARDFIRLAARSGDPELIAAVRPAQQAEP